MEYSKSSSRNKCIEKKEPEAQKIQKDVDEKQEMERSLPTQNVAYEPIGSMKPRPLFEIGNVQVKSSKKLRRDIDRFS